MEGQRLQKLLGLDHEGLKVRLRARVPAAGIPRTIPELPRSTLKYSLSHPLTSQDSGWGGKELCPLSPLPFLDPETLSPLKTGSPQERIEASGLDSGIYLIFIGKIRAEL